MRATDLMTSLERGEWDNILIELYGQNSLTTQRERYVALVREHKRTFEGEDVTIFSTSGRTELAGNHTDHNRGCVLAASVQLDTLAVVSPSEDLQVHINSEGYTPLQIDLSQLDVVESESNTSHALVRGIGRAISDRGYKLKGYRATTTSTVLKGSGLSSSAALEDLVGTIFNEICCGGKLSTTEIAQMGQYAENHYFMKPCGLMDQIACANGGIVMIDFSPEKTPLIEPVSFSFRDMGYTLMVIDTGGNHADLTDHYASIPREMGQVSQILGVTTLHESNEFDLLALQKKIRSEAGDRAFLRALHFFRENKRVHFMMECIKTGHMQGYLEGVKESGDSSIKYLQNIYPSTAPGEQGISMGLGLTEGFLGKEGACRVHGGGFAGTIQAYIPNHRVGEYTGYMEIFFGKGSATPLRIRQRPSSRII